MKEGILALLKEGLATWRTHLERRKEIYEVSLDKKRDKALNYAEEGFAISNNLFNTLLTVTMLRSEDKEEIRDIHKKFKRIEKKFNKYD